MEHGVWRRRAKSEGRRVRNRLRSVTNFVLVLLLVLDSFSPHFPLVRATPMEVLRLFIFLISLALFIGLPAWLVVKLATWIWYRRSAPRKLHPAQLHPESQFLLSFSDSTVTCARPDGTVESVRWDDLHKVEILTTSEGPLLPDCFWILHGTEKGCVIPQGATGQNELLDHLQALPGFDNRAVIEAMGSTKEATFTCWTKSPQQPEAQNAS